MYIYATHRRLHLVLFLLLVVFICYRGQKSRGRGQRSQEQQQQEEEEEAGEGDNGATYRHFSIESKRTESNVNITNEADWLVDSLLFLPLLHHLPLPLLLPLLLLLLWLLLSDRFYQPSADSNRLDFNSSKKMKPEMDGGGGQGGRGGGIFPKKKFWNNFFFWSIFFSSGRFRPEFRNSGRMGSTVCVCVSVELVGRMDELNFFSESRKKDRSTRRRNSGIPESALKCQKCQKCFTVSTARRNNNFKFFCWIFPWIEWTGMNDWIPGGIDWNSANRRIPSPSRPNHSDSIKNSTGKFPIGRFKKEETGANFATRSSPLSPSPPLPPPTHPVTPTSLPSSTNDRNRRCNRKFCNILQLETSATTAATTATTAAATIKAESNQIKSNTRK